MHTGCVLRCSLCVVRAKGTGAIRCIRWHRPRGQSHQVSARGSALFATVLRRRRAQRSRIGVDAHRGRDERICLARLAVRRLGHMCAVRCIRWHRPDGQYGPVPARGSSFLCTYGFWTATNAHQGQRTSESIGIGFPLPLHDGLHLRRVCCLRWGECVKGFIGCTARPIGPLYSTLRGLFTAPWNDL